MLVAGIVVAFMGLGAFVLLTLDSRPSRAVRYELARRRHRRRIGASLPGEHAHALIRHRATAASHASGR
jgi:hypothetical protein